MTARKQAAKKPVEPTTLNEAHELVPRLMPDPKAPLAEWVAFRRRSAAMYTRIADIDRDHHHEALYWAERELAVANELAERLRTETGQAS